MYLWKNVLALVFVVAEVSQSLEWVSIAQPQLFQNYVNQLRVMTPPRNDIRFEYYPSVDFSKPKSQSFYTASLLQHQSPVYEFKYKVHDPKESNYQEKSEIRVGDSVKGYYSVREPNGYIRLVKYKSDENGFQTAVSHYHPEDNSLAMTRHI